MRTERTAAADSSGKPRLYFQMAAAGPKGVTAAFSSMPDQAAAKPTATASCELHEAESGSYTDGLSWSSCRVLLFDTLRTPFLLQSGENTGCNVGAHHALRKNPGGGVQGGAAHTSTKYKL